MRAQAIRELGGDERGEGIVSALLLLAGALLPMLFLIALVGRVEQADLTATQLAQSAVRAAALAPSPAQAQLAAETQLAAAQSQTSAALELTLAGSFVRGGVLRAEVTAEVAAGELPLLGPIGLITLSESADDAVDLYRSLPQSP